MKKQYVILAVVVVVIGGIIVLSGLGATAPKKTNGPVPADATPTLAESVAPFVLATPEKINVEVAADEPQIFMLEPQDGVKIHSPFYLRVGTSNLKIPMLSATLHINLDAPCLPAGETILEDTQHLSLPIGKWGEPRFKLPEGQHRLCIQVADSENVALDGPGLRRMIDVEILPALPTTD
jgi:hypothetical protein